MVHAQKHKFADSLASAVTLACAFLLAKKLPKAFLLLLPWLAPSCENATPLQRQQVRGSVAQLRRRPIRSTECRMRLVLAWPLRSRQPQVTSHDLAAPAPRRRLQSGKPKAQRWTWSWRHSSSRTKKTGGILHIPAGGDDLTFQGQAGVSSSSLGCPCKGSYHTAAKLNQPDM